MRNEFLIILNSQATGTGWYKNVTNLKKSKAVSISPESGKNINYCETLLHSNSKFIVRKQE